MTKKKVQSVVIDEIITGPCPDCKVHSGLVTSVEAICAKLEEKEARLAEKIDEREKINLLRFDAQKESIATARDVLKESISVAKEVMDSRLEKMNGLYGQLQEEKQDTKEKLIELQGTFMTKERFDILHEALQIKLDSKAEAFSKDIAAIQAVLATKKEGLRWLEYLITIGVSFAAYTLLHTIFKF